MALVRSPTTRPRKPLASWLAAAAAWTAVTTAPANAVEIVVEAVDGSCATARVTATPMEAATSGNDRTLEWTAEVPGRLSVALDEERTWRLTATCPGAWAADEHLEPGASEAPLHFVLEPAGWLRARFATSAGRPPDVGRAQIRLDSPAPGGGEERRVVTFECPLDRGELHCVVPAGVADARLAIAGFAPTYAWDLRIPVGGTRDLEMLALTEGASLAGWVGATSNHGTQPIGPVVFLEPALHGPADAAEQRRLTALGDRTEADARGFFQLTGLAAGEYRLTASLPEHSSSTTTVVLRAAEETVLEEPLQLTPRSALEVFVRPVVDADGRHWYLRLLATAGRSRVLQEIAAGPATSAGFWSARDLDGGTHTLRVEDADGSPWHELPVDLPADRQLEVELDAVAVEGDLRLGDEPLAAEIFFGTARRAPRVRLTSDEEGRFQGVLPAEGEWPLEIALPGRAPQAIDPVEVFRDADGIARVSLRVPDTVLAGQVVTESGEPAPGAIVLVVRQDARAPKSERDGRAERRLRREANLTADREGRFELRGLGGGELEITAYDDLRTAPWQEVDLDERDPEEPLRLTLRPRQVLSGIVLSPDGPVPGAAVVGFPVGRGLDPFADAVTAADGSFRLEVTAGERTVDLLVSPPGYDVTVRRISPGPAPLVVEVTRSGSTLLLDGFRPPAMLSVGGAEVPLSSILSALFPLGRVDVADRRLAIRGAQPGSYAACSGADDLDCASGFLSAGGELVLTLSDAEDEDAAE